MVKVDEHFDFFMVPIKDNDAFRQFFREFKILFFEIYKDVQHPVVKLLKRAHFNGSAEKLIN